MLKVSTAQATRFGVFQVLKSSSWYGEDSTAKSALAGAAAGAASVFAFQVSYIRACTFCFVLQQNQISRENGACCLPRAKYDVY